jgi:hypothetical protein
MNVLAKAVSASSATAGATGSTAASGNFVGHDLANHPFVSVGPHCQYRFGDEYRNNIVALLGVRFIKIMKNTQVHHRVKQ